MLDSGIKLEPDRAQLVARMAASPLGSWDPESVALLKENRFSNTPGLPDKLVFGSDFPYRRSEEDLDCSLEGVGLKPSLAQGGHSNVWGAAMLPYIDGDLVGWPFGVSRLARHYAAVLETTGISARKDGLESVFPLYTDRHDTLVPGRQARKLLQRMDLSKAALRRAGIHHGAARVAVRGRSAGSDQGCVYCGMCLFGCPYGYIYNSTTTLGELRQNPLFTYEPDVVVTSLAETADAVVVRGHQRCGGGALEFKVRRLYLAAGVIPTTKLLLESAGSFDHTLWMRDSQYFLVPLVLTGRPAREEHEALYTLSQLFLEILHPAISPFAVHLQLYPYSELIGSAARQSLARFHLDRNFVNRCVGERLMIAQGFLHSNESSRIAVTLKKRASGSAFIEVKADINPAAGTLARKVVRKLLGNAMRLGALPLIPMLQIAEPGRSYHSGGTFPMRESARPFESDVLGRPQGWQRVHAVDSTVLPSIPATTITMSVMANAHRIGWESAVLD
jgi:choline dehydrogenase-like flavoprotein